MLGATDAPTKFQPVSHRAGFFMEVSMTASKKAERLEHLKNEINQHKSRLMDIERQVRELSVKKADQLVRVICKLEHWQNSK